MKDHYQGAQSKAATDNPKDLFASGACKPSFSKIPLAVLSHVAMAMMHGAEKYGPFNWRAKSVRPSIYVDAAFRHIIQWHEGQQVASDSRIHHLGHACASLLILLDAELHGCLSDDRPVKGNANKTEELFASLAQSFKGESKPDPDSWIQTFTGKQFFTTNPKPEDIDIQDIAHGLAASCRFGGHTKTFYSVAQHSVLVYYYVKSRTSDPKKWMGALLHDAPEAYVGDTPRPRKVRIPQIKEEEDKIWKAVCQKFGIDSELCELIKEADNRVLMTEKEDLMGPAPAPWNKSLESIKSVKWVDAEFKRPIIAWSPSQAENAFLLEFQFIRSTQLMQAMKD